MPILSSPSGRLSHPASATQAAWAKGKRRAKQQLQKIFDAWILHPHHDNVTSCAFILGSVGALFTGGLGVGKAIMELISLVHSLGPASSTEVVTTVVVCLSLAGGTAMVLVAWLFWRAFSYALWSSSPPSIEAFDPSRARSSGDSMFSQRCHNLVAAKRFHALTAWEWALARWLWNTDSPLERKSFLDAVLPDVESAETPQRRF